MSSDNDNTPHAPLPLIAQLLSARRRATSSLRSCERNRGCLLCEHTTKQRRLALCERCERVCVAWSINAPSALEELTPWVVSAMPYHGPLYQALQQAKGGDLYTARRLAQLITSLPNAERSTTPLIVGDPLLLVPLPPRRARLIKRGFSLQHLCATQLARALHSDVQLAPRALSRARASSPQSSLSREARLNAQRDTLSASSAVQGRAVCLLDDVCTTGATLVEARRACLAAGAHAVEALTLFYARS